MKQYLELLQDVLDNGARKSDRTNTGTYSVFGRQLRFDLRKGFPLLTTKKMHFKSIVHELLWFLRGDTNIKYLNDNNVNIWNEWADENNDLGPVYGKQWRRWTKYENIKGHVFSKEIDQIAEVIEQIKTNPDSRRLIVSAWNVGELDQMRLEPCHNFFQFYVVDGTLSLMLNQRSVDAVLGCPFNISSYSLLLMMVAHVCGLKAGELIHTMGDTHIYMNHLDVACRQLKRQPFELPDMELNPEIKNIDDFRYEDIVLKNYKCHGRLKAEVAV